MEALFLIAFIAALAGAAYLKSPSVIGAAGERKVNRKLLQKIETGEDILLTDVTLPTADGTTQVDQILLARSGIYVIETKNMSGWVFGSENQRTWTQVLHRKKIKFQNPLRQNYKHVKAVENVLGVPQNAISNLVVFAGTAEPKTDMPDTVFWSSKSLAHYIASQRARCYPRTELQAFAEKLRQARFEETRETRRNHIKHTRAKAVQKASAPFDCPKCGAEMKQRKNKKTGEQFLGCSRFPKCRGTRKL